MSIESLELILQYGTTPALVLIAIMLLWFKKDVAQRIGSIERCIRETRNKIDYIEQAYVKKEDLYKDISGWRGDVRVLTAKLDNLREEFFYLKGRYEELKEKRDAA